jgi:3'-phosphoadenosine 5'-phosphosulfate sulfotransferase (PAPS reductase)/FAD synthetase
LLDKQTIDKYFKYDDEEVIISFSGGRTSALMLKYFVEAHNGTLPKNINVIFSNTGKEMPETLDFVQECSEQYGVKIIWVEFCKHNRMKVVDYNTASRDGQPFAELIDKKSHLPNPTMRFCTSEMKITPMKLYVKNYLNYEQGWINCVGLRYDEGHRVKRLNGMKEKFFTEAPLYHAKIAKHHVFEHWEKSNWDLNLQNVNGSTPAGNCDLCFLKGQKTIQTLMRQNPGIEKWWIEQEKKTFNGRQPFFRRDRAPYETLQKQDQDQPDLFDGGTACVFCHD